MKNPLPHIIAGITGKQRERVDIVWSQKSWVHNIFRAWELIAWRKVGIRAEVTSVHDGNRVYYHFHSWESVFAHAESLIRGVFKFRIHVPYKIIIPKLQMSTGFQIPMPFLFAIAHDADGVASITNGFLAGPTTKTFNHTITGSNTLIVGTYMVWQDTGGTGTVTTNTYNALTLTKITNTRQASMASELWYRIAPTTGTNTMSVTVTGAIDAVKLSSTSFTGADQSAPLDASSTAIGSTGNPAASVTSVASDCAVVAVLSRFSTTAATSNKTSIFNDATGSTLGAASYEITTGAGGSKTNTYTGTAAQDWSMCIASFKPSAGAVVTNSNFFLLF